MNDNHTTIRMLLTTAVVAAFAALLAGPASAYVMDVEGGGGSGSATVAAQPQVEPGTIPYLSHGVGVDQTPVPGRDDERRASIPRSARRSRRARRPHVAKALTEKGPIPYLSHGIGVDQSLFQGEQSLGLTGDSPITRVVGLEPQGLTGDSPRTRGAGLPGQHRIAVDGHRRQLDVGRVRSRDGGTARGGDGCSLSSRRANRDRVALP